LGRIKIRGKVHVEKLSGLDGGVSSGNKPSEMSSWRGPQKISFVFSRTGVGICFDSFLSSLLKSSSLPRIVKYSAKVTVEEVAYRGEEQNGLYYWLTRLDFSIQKWVNNKSVWIGMLDKTTSTYHSCRQRQRRRIESDRKRPRYNNNSGYLLDTFTREILILEVGVGL
jgi:hypothetical protein